MASKEYLENITANNTNFTFPKFKLNYFSNEFKDMISLKNNDNEEMLCVEKLKCKICFHLISRERLRVHVAKHIIKNETSKSPNLCGFCGTVGCSIDLKQSSTKNHLKPKSNCSFYYKFNIRSVKKISSRSPSTNHPVFCRSCKDDQCFWSYNLKLHYIEKHPLIEINLIEKETIPSNEEIEKLLGSTN